MNYLLILFLGRALGAALFLEALLTFVVLSGLGYYRLWSGNGADQLQCYVYRLTL